MALLDISEVIRDPDFTSPVKLIKRVESYDTNGNPVWSDGSSFSINAVVSNDLRTIKRLPESLQREGTIVVRFVVSDAQAFTGVGYDRIVWREKSFLVTDCADYSQFGEGFIRLVCSPEDAYDSY